ncbi:MAG: hypothetical protein QG632_246 [Candidatus Dependentiae bacterium]|nr:hypothetical protein [Candidatus Dependentiae bacterium]
MNIKYLRLFFFALTSLVSASIVTASDGEAEAACSCDFERSKDEPLSAHLRAGVSVEKTSDEVEKMLQSWEKIVADLRADVFEGDMNPEIDSYFAYLGSKGDELFSFIENLGDESPVTMKQRLDLCLEDILGYLVAVHWRNTPHRSSWPSMDYPNLSSYCLDYDTKCEKDLAQAPSGFARLFLDRLFALEKKVIEGRLIALAANPEAPPINFDLDSLRLFCGQRCLNHSFMKAKSFFD